MFYYIDLDVIIDTLQKQDKEIHAQIKKSCGARWAKEKYSVIHKAQNAIADALTVAVNNFSAKNFLLAIRQNRKTDGTVSDRPVCRGCDGARVNTFVRAGKVKSVPCEECNGTGIAPKDWKEREDYQ